MKKNLLYFIGLFLFFAQAGNAQVTGTYIVADNGTRLSSCEDTLITLPAIYEKLGIRDLNDPNDDVSLYRILRLNGSVITEDELTSFKYSDYSAVYIDKPNTPFNGHNGIQIFLNIVDPPTALFDKDSLKYTVERGATINYVNDFFAHINVWSSGLDNVPLQERILFTNLEDGIEKPITQVPTWTTLGKGEYRIRFAVAICGPTDLLWDTLYVIVQESLCNSIQIKNAPSVCLDEVTDITPYVYINNQVATSAELNDMTFYDRSLLTNPNAGAVLDPTAINIGMMYNNSTLYPIIEPVYQPNVAIGTCAKYNYIFTTKVPTKLFSTSTIITTDNYGYGKTFTIEGDYYGINDVFDKNTLKALYIDNYNVFAGTTFDFYTDDQLQNPVTGNNLTPGTYYISASNPACTNDATEFTVNIKNRDFDIIWQGASNIGKGYYTFTAPEYDGATYSWFVWGGSIVSGLNTKEVLVYYSENASKNVLVTCTITLAAGRTSSGNTMGSAVYLSATGQDGTMEVLTPQVVTGVDQPVINTEYAVAYPNPAETSFMISGNGTFELTIYNTLGQQVFEDKNYVANTPITIQSKGVHLIRLNQNDKNQTLKVMLK
jgi:hypothetical protein